MDYMTVKELALTAEKKRMKISELVLKEQSEAMEVKEDVLFAKMEEQLDVMLDAIDKGSEKENRSTSGLTGGDADKL